MPDLFISSLHRISSHLKSRGECLSTAEGGTGGFAELPDAAAFYSGGITSCGPMGPGATGTKTSKQIAVSLAFTESMALKVAELLSTEWAVATAGYATPERCREAEAYFAIAYRGQIILSYRIALHPRTQAVDAGRYFMESILGFLQCELIRREKVNN